MTSTLVAFQSDLYQKVLRAAAAEAVVLDDAFFEYFARVAVEAGELATADRAFHRSRGLAVDGYGGSPADNDGTLTLIVADFVHEQAPATITQTEMDALFKKLGAYLEKSLDADFRAKLEETSAAFGLSDLIAESWTATDRIRFVLLTNRPLSKRVDGMRAGSVSGRVVSHSVWDASRLFRFESSGREREELVVDLEEHGGPLPALPAHLEGADYEAYLIVIPGSQLASIYDRWGTRLLEQNVRVFLQAKGGVNRGIKTTLESDPSMFFAYNNGVTATAERVEAVESGGRVLLRQLYNLQIVNGGQTTASIYAASRRSGVQLERVFVQMKLSIIPEQKAKEVVPKISEYANSQNKVNAADFFANHPFHLRVKQFSNTTYAPAVDGTVKQSRWFYERARGEYQDARGRLSPAQRNNFDLEFPRDQIFTKTDLAKYLAVWDELPHIVSKGAQTNFVDFAGRIGESWAKSDDAYNERFFRECVAKALIFKETERLVSAQEWYEGAYRANIVAYGIAKLAHDVASLRKSVDFEKVWRNQGADNVLRQALVTSSHAALEVIISPPAGAVKNITEWAKRPGAWTRLSELEIPWSSAFLKSLIGLDELRSSAREANRDQKLLNGVQAQIAVVSAGRTYWRDAYNWALANRRLSQKELDILKLASREGSVLTEKQSVVAVEAAEKLITDGCQQESPLRLIPEAKFED